MIQVSVIIANRNNAKFLNQCLQSVYQQTLQPSEIIVVDDASTDDSRLVLESHVRSGGIALIKNETPLGVSRSRSRAVEYCKSPFITTLDADDYYYNRDKLAAESAALGDCDQGRIAFSDVMRVKEDGCEIGLVSSWRRLREGDLSFYISHLDGFIPRDYVVSRKDYLAAGGYDRSLKIYEDWDLKIRLARMCSWKFSGVIGTSYRDNPRGLSRSPVKEHISTIRQIFWSNCQVKQPVLRVAAFTRFFFYHSKYLKRLAI